MDSQPNNSNFKRNQLKSTTQITHLQNSDQIKARNEPSSMQNLSIQIPYPTASKSQDHPSNT